MAAVLQFNKLENKINYLRVELNKGEKRRKAGINRLLLHEGAVFAPPPQPRGSALL